jgi:hypothetical protein
MIWMLHGTLPLHQEWWKKALLTLPLQPSPQREAAAAAGSLHGLIFWRQQRRQDRRAASKWKPQKRTQHYNANA